jgi:hypothetical protein
MSRKKYLNISKGRFSNFDLKKSILNRIAEVDKNVKIKIDF